MPATPPPPSARPAARRSPARRGAGKALGALLGLALVSTAGAGTVTVRPGDTLSEIAERLGVSTSALRAANGISGDHIEAGEVLQLPGARSATTSSSTSTRTHVVRSGENVSVIAHRYGTSTASVLRANGLRSDGYVRPGRRLSIPVTTRTVRGDSSPTTVATRVTGGSVASSAARNRARLDTRALPSKREARRTVAATARRYGVPVPLALAVAYHESGFQQRVVSPVDAIGVMQVLPRTGRNLSQQVGRDLDLLDTEDNITAGVLLLRQLLRSTGSEDAALAAYYQGLGSIARKGVLPQTTAYLASIDALKPRFANG